MKKKITLYKHFKQYFRQSPMVSRAGNSSFLEREVELEPCQANNVKPQIQCSSITSLPDSCDRSLTFYVRNFFKSKHGILMKFNSTSLQVGGSTTSMAIVQLCLADGTEVILDQMNQRLVYSDPEGVVHQLSTKVLADKEQYSEKHELVKRLLYMKKMSKLMPRKKPGLRAAA